MPFLTGAVSGGLSTAYITGGTLNFGAAEGKLMTTGYETQIDSVITGSGGLTVAGGTTYLNGANTYTGVTSASALTVSGPSPLGASGPGNGTIIYGGGITINGVAPTIINDDIQFIGTNAGSGIVSNNAGVGTVNGNLTIGDGVTPTNLQLGGSLTVNGNITNNQTTGATTLDLSSGYNVLKVNGTISDAGSAPMAVTTAGSQSNGSSPYGVCLTGANNYRGGTTVAANSTLVVSNTTGSATGSGNVVIAAKGTPNAAGRLLGSGLLDPISGATVQNFGIISPGYKTIGGAVGMLTIGSAANPSQLLAYGGSSFLFHLGHTGSDEITVFGGIVLEEAGITISIADAGDLTPGLYTLFTYTGTLDGSFSDLTLALGQGLNGTLVNDTTDHAIEFNATVVPEPSTDVLLSLLLLGGAAACYRFRQRRV